MSKFLMDREESLLFSPIQNLTLWRKARENLQGIARDRLLKMSTLPYEQKPKWYRGKNIVSDGPSPPSVQPPEEEEFFPTPFPHLPVGGRLAHFLNQWQLITSDKWVLSVLWGRGVWNFSSRVDLLCHQFLWTYQWRGTQTGISCFKKRCTLFCRKVL